jgi:thiol-disulfide isomerase/thioredoxin
MKLMGYAAVAVVAAAVGFGVFRYGMAPALVPAVAPAPAPEPVAATAEPQSGPPTTLPEFSLQDRDGQMRSIRSWPGKSMIVNFWATWCAPCRREIPLLRQIQQQHGADGFQIVGVAVDFRDDVLKYAGETGIDYPILIGEDDGLEAVNKFGLGSLGFPFTVFTDTQGQIVLTHLGELTKPQADVMIDTVGKVNRGELTVAAARVVATKQLEQLATPSG